LENGEDYEYPWKQRYIDEDGQVFDMEQYQEKTLAERIGHI
jgi:hypothetical protein